MQPRQLKEPYKNKKAGRGGGGGLITSNEHINLTYGIGVSSPLVRADMNCYLCTKCSVPLRVIRY